MALNSGSLNRHALNGAPSIGFVSDTGTYTVNIEQVVNSKSTYTANVVQVVGAKAAAASHINIVQIVEAHYEATYTANIVQAVKSKSTYSVNVEQLVRDPNANDFQSRNGYEPILIIGGSLVSTDEIHGQIKVVFREDEAPQLTFTLIPPRGTQDIRSYRGKTVILTVREGGSSRRVFTGKINTPDVSIIDQKIQFNCSLDVNQEVEDNVSQEFIDSIGFYEDTMFSTPRKKIDELRDRLSTVPQVMGWNAYGKLEVHDIAPGTADYTLGNSDVYRESLDYVFSSQQRYVNKVKITAKYTHQRLHHYQITFNATMGVNSFCNWALQKFTPMRRDLISSAANGVGWPITDLTFTEFFPSGYYNCSGGTIGFITNSCSTTNTPVTDDNGNQVQINGENQFESNAQSCTSTTANLCLGASWKGSTHFAQNIERDYVLEVTAPQSISDYGTKLREETYNLTDEYNPGEWENYSKYSNVAPDGFSKTGTSGVNFWVDTPTQVNKFSKAVDVLLNRAKATILKSHRDDKVMFKRSLWTAVSLGDTVELDTNRVDAKGKVYSYTHTMDINTGEAFTNVTIALSRSTGSTSDSSLALPALDLSAIDPVYPVGSISYDANYGIDASTLSNPSGYYGNYLQQSGSGLRLTQVPVTFVATIPAIPDTLRKKRVVSDTTTFNVAIPNDTLTIYFPDDNYT